MRATETVLPLTELVPVAEPGPVERAAAAALGVQEGVGGHPPSEAIVEQVGDGAVLRVLGNRG